jgi:hypothetical protein
MRGARAQVRQRGGEERRGGLAHHRGLDAGRLFQPGDKGPAVELQAVAGAPVQARCIATSLAPARRQPKARFSA